MDQPQSIDLSKYMGKWYEIQRSENSFQKKCIARASTEYTLFQNGYVRIQNACRTARGISKVSGWGWVTDNTNTRLRVSFLPIPRTILRHIPLVSGRYDIVYVDANYSVAIVRSGKLYWILSRNRTMSALVVNRLIDAHIR